MFDIAPPSRVAIWDNMMLLHQCGYSTHEGIVDIAAPAQPVFGIEHCLVTCGNRRDFKEKLYIAEMRWNCQLEIRTPYGKYVPDESFSERVGACGRQACCPGIPPC